MIALSGVDMHRHAASPVPLNQRLRVGGVIAAGSWVGAHHVH